MKKISFRADILPLKNELFRLALRITLNNAEAEDVVQETLIKVWDRREQWDEIESIQAFCLTICRNLSLDRMKRMDNRNASIDAEGSSATPAGNQHPTYSVADHSYGANPEEQAIQRDRVRLVRQLIDQLPEKQRSCMQLRDIEGRAYKEIAEVLGISEQQVKVNIHRARQTVRQQFIESERYGL